MTPEQFQERWTPALNDDLRGITLHHFRLLPDPARSAMSARDMGADVLAAVFDDVLSHFKYGDAKAFEHFCKYQIRKHCLTIRRMWRTKKRWATVISTETLQNDYWVPRHREDDSYPADEAAWTLAVIEERGLTPLDKDAGVCFNCGDAARPLRGGRVPASGELVRTCFDPKCQAVKQTEVGLLRYHRGGDAERARRRARYAARANGEVR